MLVIAIYRIFVSKLTFFPHIFLQKNIFFLRFSQSLLGQCKLFFHESVTRRRPIQSRLQISDGSSNLQKKIFLITI